VTDTSPTIRHRELGTRLRQLRNGLGLTFKEVREKLLCSATKISRIETGACRPSLSDVRDLYKLYDVNELGTAELMKLAKMTREQGWRSLYSDLKLGPYIGLEQGAASISCFSVYYVPALKAKKHNYEMPKAIETKMDPEVHKQKVKAQPRRQQLLKQEMCPQYHTLLDETGLGHRIGDPAVMATQQDKILNLGRDGKATLQVIPLEIGVHTAQDSNFVLLELQDPRPVAPVEGLATNLYHGRDGHRCREAVEYLCAEALSSRDSFIAEAQENYASK
jgi:transcriptional regulator with XRE-family HTH domain